MRGRSYGHISPTSEYEIDINASSPTKFIKLSSYSNPQTYNTTKDLHSQHSVAITFPNPTNKFFIEIYHIQGCGPVFPKSNEPIKLIRDFNEYSMMPDEGFPTN